MQFLMAHDTVDTLAQIVCDDYLPTALYAAHCLGDPLTMPALTQAKLLHGRVRREWTSMLAWAYPYTTISGEYIGKDKQGTPWLLIDHTDTHPFANTGRLQLACDAELLHGAGRLAQSEFHQLVNSTTVPTLHIADILTGADGTEARIIVPWEQARALPNGYRPPSQLRTDALFVARLGSMAQANALCDTLDSAGWTRYGNHHPFASVDADDAHGRLLMQGRGYAGLTSTKRFSGNVVYVAARIAPKSDLPSEEEIVRILVARRDGL